MKNRRSLFSLRGLGRLSSITRVLIRHGFGDVADRITGGAKAKPAEGVFRGAAGRTGFPSPRRVRRVLEELGPSFIKLGQLMSIRADIFPPEYIEEFRLLQDRVPPEPLSAIQKTIETELRRPLSEIFETFDPAPIAAASVAQVHTAKLFGGERVAVKIVRPDIDKKIREDIRLMYVLAAKIEKAFELGRIIGMVNLVQEFERTIFQELDMLIEAGHIEKFARNFKDTEEIHIARVFWEYTTKSVLVMEYIPGIKIDQVAQLQAHGIDPKKIARIGLDSFSRQLMEFGFFHADPHPGNTIVMYDGRVSLVDFGIIGYLDEEMMVQIANLFLGYAEHDYELVLGALLDAGLINEDTVDLKRFRTDLKDTSEPFYGRTLQNISVRDVYEQIMQLVFKYQIHLPRNLLLLLKTFIQTEALGKILGSDASLLETTRPFAKKLLERGYDTRKVFQNLGREARALSGYMKMLPKFVHDILRQTAGGRQRLELWHGGFQQLDSKFEKGVNRLTVGIIISASTMAAALILNSSQKVIEFDVNLFGLKAVSITALLGLTGYTIATILGVWLIISILRSGRM